MQDENSSSCFSILIMNRNKYEAYAEIDMKLLVHPCGNERALPLQRTTFGMRASPLSFTTNKNAQQQDCCFCLQPEPACFRADRQRCDKAKQDETAAKMNSLSLSGTDQGVCYFKAQCQCQLHRQHINTPHNCRPGMNQEPCTSNRPCGVSNCVLYSQPVYFIAS